MLHSPSFLMSCAHWKQWPKDSTGPIVAFWGRSNVGKSSLINTLTQSKIAHVSKTPGRTRLLNLFEIKKPRLLLCDLPGYGYAQISKSESAEIQERLNAYFYSPCRPHLLCWIIDIRHGLTKSDLELAELMRDFASERDLLVIATKSDKLSSQQQQKAMAHLEQQLALEGLGQQGVLCLSSLSKKGFAELSDLLERFSAAYHQDQ